MALKKKAPANKVTAKKVAAKKVAPKKPASNKEVAVKKSSAPKKKTVIKKEPVRRRIGSQQTRRPSKKEALDLSAFPRESIVEYTKGLCLACALDVLTRHMGLRAERASTEIRKHTPTVEELAQGVTVRPYLPWPSESCPNCGAPAKWHAPLPVVSIEGGKTTEAARRALLKKIGNGANFAVIEEKSTERNALYHWLANTGSALDLDSPEWLLEATRHWLGRRLPKEDWATIFAPIRFVRRSRRLEEGFEVDGPRLFLSPALFDEVLFVQYLLSRSHKAGGLTFEGRMTLMDLFQRLRGGGYLRHMNVAAGNPSDALEQLVELLGGEGRVKFYYVVDRRGLLERLGELKGARVPRPVLV